MTTTATNIKTVRCYRDFMTDEWPAIFTEYKRVMQLTPEETAKMQNHSTAHLIAYIPYIAGCSDFQRYSIAELGIYCIATRSAPFKHRLDETILHRVAILTGFPGGDKRAKQAGMILLALILISDHKKDLNDNIAQKMHNPLIFMAENDIDRMEGKLWKKFKILTAGKDWDFDFFKKYVPYAWWY